ncbi:MAG: GerAB/ArcD/ProY family transporter [Christensenellaceae bacterium]|jgi:spore germination protein KB|nr:GerAB/ArcD/ProY family transporter [Christensenellaceae bacterium]
MDNARPKISFLQGVLTLSGSLLMLSFYMMPMVKSNKPMGSNVWLSILVAIPYFVVFGAPTVLIAAKYKIESFGDLAEKALGKTGMKITAVFLALFLLVSNMVYVVVFGLFARESLLEGFPLWLIYAVTAVPIIYTTTKGIGSVCRMATVFIPLMFIGIIVFAILGFNSYELYNLAPSGGKVSLLDLNIQAILIVGQSSEFVAILVFNRNLNKKVNREKFFCVATLILIAFMLLIVLPTLLTLGYEYMRSAVNPYFVFMRQVGMYGDIERIQALGVFLSIPAFLIRAATQNCAVTEVLNCAFPKPDKRIFSVGAGLCIFLTLLLPTFTESAKFSDFVSVPYFEAASVIIVFVLPLILLIFLKVRKIKPVEETVRN